MRVTKWGEYGILCAMYMAKNSLAQLGAPSPKKDQTTKPVGAQEIADACQIPIQYAQQILQRLRRGKIIKSVRGPHGGYELTRPAQEITMKDLLHAAEGRVFEFFCDQKPIYTNCCEESGAHCGLKSLWQEMNTAIEKLLEERTLESLIRQDSRLVTIQSTKNILAKKAL